MILALLFGCSPSSDDIATAISSKNPVMREDGAKIAQNYPDAVVEAALIVALQDPARTVRLNAIESLAEIESTTAGPALVSRLELDDDPLVRRAAADALGRLKFKDAAPSLVAYIATFAKEDRQQLCGVWALGSIGAEGLDEAGKTLTLDTLVRLRDTTPDKHIRYQTSAALRTLR